MDYRFSSYSIVVPLESEPDNVFMMHGYTGAIDVLSKDIAEYLQNHKHFSKEEIPCSETTMKALEKRGYITKWSEEEEVEYAKRIVRVLQKRNKYMWQKSFTILVTYNCNFKCPYCFEKDNIDTISLQNNRAITKEYVDLIFETIKVLEPNSQLHNHCIQLFGGEPLLKDNKEIVTYIINKGREYGFTFIATSNGYDIDTYEDLLSPDKLKGIQITIDGPKHIHDTRRIHAVYGKSFEKIVNNIKLALYKNVAIQVRINVDSQNIEALHELNDYFTDNGFYSMKNFSVYAEYISGNCNFNPIEYNYSLKSKHMSRKHFLDAMKLTNNKIKFEANLYSKISFALTNKKGLLLSPIHCVAHGNSYVFDPYGRIFSCLEMVGKQNNAIGTYSPKLNWTKKKDEWFNKNITDIQKCIKCKYAFLCGGGCYAKAMSRNQESICDDYGLRLKYICQKIYSELVSNSIN